MKPKNRREKKKSDFAEENYKRFWDVEKKLNPFM
jgi:hypothetical protein